MPILTPEHLKTFHANVYDNASTIINIDFVI